MHAKKEIRKSYLHLTSKTKCRAKDADKFLMSQQPALKYSWNTIDTSVSYKISILDLEKKPQKSQNLRFLPSDFLKRKCSKFSIFEISRLKVEISRDLTLKGILPSAVPSEQDLILFGHLL